MATKEDRKANRLRTSAREINYNSGESAVLIFGRKNKLPFSPCESCECDTPILTHSKGSECLLCGAIKEKVIS